ncbi:hypothetical protein [Foetidibacter luteolus]|uniref:hypothetical protein n=1 Tax=Foetidibacter luteolus TaxID=2608880 RepID=UPI00129AF089|nr:hypothetical protein [Foetidibacter luteolus]
MTAFTKLFQSSFVLFLLSCNPQQDGSAGKTTPLIQKNTSIKNERNNKLFVFVGEKIEVTPLPYTPGDFDSGVKAKFLILQRVYGYYDKDTIEFEAYDHYGRFPFADYKNVLLYVSEYEGKLYQEKYMYDPVFKTKDGRWAGPYSDDYGHSYNKHTTVKPEKIDFAEEVSFPTKIKDDDGKEYTLSYDEPYFKLVGDKAIAVYGNFVPELFKLKKEGVLTARELFGDKKPEIKEVELQEISDTTDKN